MSNLKKVLALTLVLALSLSLFISAGAGFKDVAVDDPNAAAYSLLADLKIAQGYDDGTFQPDTYLTRETAVTFIFRMATGMSNADYMKGATKFPDVAADRWSSGYINWAVEKGIVAGDPDGNFAPSRTVTVAELSKMLVVALGYDAKNYNFPWGFVDKAQDLGLLSGLLDKSANTPATRGMTSVIIKNALFSNGRIEVVNNTVNSLPSFATAKFGIVSTTKRLVGTSNLVGASAIGAAQNKVAFGNTASDVFTFSGNVDALFGRQVTVWYKDADSNGTLGASDTIVSIVAKGGDKVVSANAANITRKSGDTNYTAIIDGTKYDFGTATDSLSVYSYNYGASSTVTLAKNTNVIVYGVDDDGDKDFEFVYAVEPFVAQISNITSAGAVSATAVAPDTQTLSSVAKEQIKAYEGMAKNDYVYVYPSTSVYKNSSGTVTKGTVYTIVKANVLSNVQVTAKSADGNTYTIGGTGYKLAWNSDSSASIAAPTLGNFYDLIVSPTGFAFAFNTVSASTSTVYGVVIDVTAQLSADGTYKNRTVTVLKGDGTSAAYTAVDATSFGSYTTDTYGWAPTTGGVAAIFRKPVVLTLNADGKVTAIADMTSAPASSTAAYNTNTGIVTMTGSDIAGSYTLTSDTVVFYIPATGAIKAYQGASIPSFGATTATHFMYDNTSALKPVKVIVVGASLSAVSSNNDGYVQYTGNIYEGGAEYYTYKVAYQGEVKTLKATTTNGATINAALGGTPTVPAYMKLTVDSNGFLTGVTTADTALSATNASLTAKSGNVVVIGGNLYTLKSDAKVLLMDVKGTAGSYTMSAPTAFGTLADVPSSAYVSYIANASNEISFIVIYNDID